MMTMAVNQNSANPAEGTMLYGILYTNNDIGTGELRREIRENKILPVLILRVDPEEHGEPNEHVIVPCFNNLLVAKQFARRNLPKGHLIATIQLNQESVEKLVSKGYEIFVYTWPRRLTKYCHLDLEVIENSVTPEIKVMLS
jgi:hypothetical protein